MDSWLQRVWYGRSVWASVLWPLSLLFGLLAFLRRAAYRTGLLRRVKVAKPVIVVGNITVGGTGKTPLVIWLAQQLLNRGYRPAVITRGYGGSAASWPIDVSVLSDPALVGDEAVLIAQRTGVLVVAGPNRVTAAQLAIDRGADVIVSDDGLQHYRMTRDFEIAVMDGARGVGNGMLLPAGPLRESPARLDTVDAVAVTERAGHSSTPAASSQHNVISVRGTIREARSLLGSESRPLSTFATRPIHAIAGIGNPQAFFAALRDSGLDVDGRPLPDHAGLTKDDLSFNDNAPVFMTEKDAVKCRAFADSRFWVVPLELEVKDGDRLLSMIEASIRKA